MLLIYITLVLLKRYGMLKILSSWETNNESPIPPPPPACEAATLSPYLELYIPRLEYQTAFGIAIPLQVDMVSMPSDEEQISFEVKNYEILPE